MKENDVIKQEGKLYILIKEIGTCSIETFQFLEPKELFQTNTGKWVIKVPCNDCFKCSFIRMSTDCTNRGKAFCSSISNNGVSMVLKVVTPNFDNIPMNEIGLKDYIAGIDPYKDKHRNCVTKKGEELYLYNALGIQIATIESNSVKIKNGHALTEDELYQVNDVRDNYELLINSVKED